MHIDFVQASENDFNEVESHSLGGLDSSPRKNTYVDLVQAKSYYMIQVDNTIAGSFSYVILWDDTIMIQFLRIKESYRRKGIGKQVVNFLNDIGKSKGCEDFMSTALAENTNSLLFHESVGFKKKGNISFSKEEIVFLKDIV